MKIISVIGYSGSGKTNLIINAINLLKENLDYNVIVIKNIHEHQIDEEDKDTYKFGDAGAIYSITKNIINETTIFLKKKIQLNDLINWIKIGPFKIDLCFLEGFRNTNYPTILCLKNSGEFSDQFNEHVNMISGIICSNDIKEKKGYKIPIVDILKGFDIFLKIFNIH